MTEAAIWILFLLTGAMLIALVWLFTEMHDTKKRAEDLESDMHQWFDSQDIIRRRVSRVEDEVQKLKRGEQG